MIRRPRLENSLVSVQYQRHKQAQRERDARRHARRLAEFKPRAVDLWLRALGPVHVLGSLLRLRDGDTRCLLEVQVRPVHNNIYLRYQHYFMLMPYCSGPID